MTMHAEAVKVPPIWTEDFHDPVTEPAPSKPIAVPYLRLMTPTRAYLAGPMRGIDQFNYPSFNRAALKLRAAGYEVFNLAEQERTINRTYEEDMRTGLAWILEQAECAFFLQGWRVSMGAFCEWTVLTTLALPCYNYWRWEESGQLEEIA